MKPATLCIPIKNGKLLLGNKKRGFGKNKLNGFGGKINSGESVEEAAIREVKEEIGIDISKKDLKKVGELTFKFPSPKEDWNQIVHVFFINSWKNEPKESEEMTCEWFKKEEIPFDKMWDDDKHWLPLVLDGKRIKATFIFDKDNATVKHKKILDLK